VLKVTDTLSSSSVDEAVEIFSVKASKGVTVSCSVDSFAVAVAVVVGLAVVGFIVKGVSIEKWVDGPLTTVWEVESEFGVEASVGSALCVVILGFERVISFIIDESNLAMD
jgi:hypothetical protein